MADESIHPAHDHHKEKGMNNAGFAGGVYSMAFIGALFYYILHAVSFWTGVLGFVKALFWPTFLIYQLLEFLKM